ncbi:MAG: DUF2752 domain-containing protein [Sedimentisphaerales bacterium]|nr:DUF2752 domain-containing protein [Sedimentisphaerales bacterium]
MQTSQQLNRPKLFYGATKNQRLTATVIWVSIAGFFGIFAVAGHYDADMGFWLGRCGLKDSTGYPCPTCGMTTAAKAFAQGKIREAFHIQPAGCLLYSIAVFVAILSFVISVFGVYFRFVERFFAEVKVRYIILALLIILLSGWAVTFTRAYIAKH